MITKLQFEKIKDSNHYKDSIFYKNNIEDYEDFKKFLKKEFNCNNIDLFISNVFRTIEILHGSSLISNEDTTKFLNSHTFIQILQFLCLDKNRDPILKSFYSKKVDIERRFGFGNDFEKKIDILIEISKLISIFTPFKLGDKNCFTFEDSNKKNNFAKTANYFNKTNDENKNCDCEKILDKLDKVLEILNKVLKENSRMSNEISELNKRLENDNKNSI